MCKLLFMLCLLCTAYSAITVLSDCKDFSDEDSCFEQCDCCWDGNSCHNVDTDTVEHCHISHSCDVYHDIGIAIVSAFALGCVCCCLLVLGFIAIALLAYICNCVKSKQHIIVDNQDTLYGYS